MISVGKLVRAEQTLVDLVHKFESLAEKYHRAEEALNAGQSLDVHRRDVDSMYSISAGMCLLVAVERGFIRSVDSAVWNLFDARTNRINNQIREYSRLEESWKELADPSPSRTESLSYGGYLLPYSMTTYSATESPTPAEPIDLDALRRDAESHLQEITQLQAKLELESDLDLTSDDGQWLLMWTWAAFVRLELVPSHVSEFRPDWQERLPPPDFFLAYGVKDSGQRNQPRSFFEKMAGETKEDRHRFCVASRANIYGAACRVIAKLLRAEIARRLSEIGRLQTSGDAAGGVSSTLVPKAITATAATDDGGQRSSRRGSPRKGKAGRPKVDGEDEKRDLQLFADWQTAKTAGIAAKDFCTDKGIKVPELDRVVDWVAKRRRRGQL